MFLKSKWTVLALVVSIVGCWMGLQAMPVGQPDLGRMVLNLTVPPADEMYRGLLAEIEMQLVVHFEEGKVLAVEPVKVTVRSAFDPLPARWGLEQKVSSWAASALKRWTAMRQDRFHLEVWLEFRTDPSLDDAAVVYRVEYDRNGPDPIASYPARISITAAPGNVEGWRKMVEHFRQLEEDLRQLREEFEKEATEPKP
jgi:hypothetical protein